MLVVVGIPEATYHYQVKQLKKADPDQEWKKIISELFQKHEGKYGYRRIYLELRTQGFIINHKKVQALAFTRICTIPHFCILYTIHLTSVPADKFPPPVQFLLPNPIPVPSP